MYTRGGGLGCCETDVPAPGADLEGGLDVEVKLVDTTSWAASRRVGQRVSGAKTIVERGTDRLVGAHLLGHGSDEVIDAFPAAMGGG